MPQGILKLADEEFWSAPWKTRDAAEDAQGQKDALLVDAPGRVPLKERETLPLLALRIGKTADELAMPFEKFAIAVASDAASGRTYANLAVAPPREQVEESGPVEVDESSRVSLAYAVDLRKRLQLPWRPSRLSVSLILREQISEPLEVELAGDARPAGEEQLPPVTGVLEPEGAPEVPAKPGLALAAPRVFDTRTAGPLKLTGAYRLPAFARVKPDKKSKEKLPAALVPITLVVTASRSPAPLVWTMTLPCDKLDGEMAAGQFAVDLDDGGNIRLPDRTFFVYAFAGAHRFGPLPIAMIED